MCNAGRVLLDAETNAPVVAGICEVTDASLIRATISDLHVWRVGKHKHACMVSPVARVTRADAQPGNFKRQLRVQGERVPLTADINRQSPSAFGIALNAP